MTLDEWMREGRYLPRRMRDFHDQKDIFKAAADMLRSYQAGAAPHNKAIKALTWADLHMVSIDVFLWFMALHGYTLQKSPAKLDFRDLNESITVGRTRSLEALRDALGETPRSTESEAKR